MLRMKPSVITLTAGEVTDAEHRLRFRRHLRHGASEPQPAKNSLATEQNRDSQPRQQISSSPAFKVGASHASPGGIRRALESWRPQSSAASAEPLDTDESTTVWEQEQSASPTEPRLMQLSPRVLDRSMLLNWHRHVGSGRPAFGESNSNSKTTDAASIEDHTVDEPQQRETEAADRILDARLSPSSRVASPELPSPFSQTVRVHGVMHAARVSNYDDEDSPTNTDSSPPVNTDTRPPVTPIRRSSLSIRPFFRSLDGQSEDRRDRRARVNEPVSTRTRSGRYRRTVPTALEHPTTTPRATERFSRDTAPEAPSTGLARLRIYNDSLPRSSQLETPQNLPESRHQSRLWGAYTAPARRHGPAYSTTPTTSRRRWDRNRVPSPIGLLSPGFRGLYGGLENSDDAILFEHAETISSFGREQRR